MIATVVYILCAVTSTACALVLLAARRRTREPLLSWAAGCFCLLALNNAILVVDLAVLGDAPDLHAYRSAAALAGFLLLLTGLVLDTTRRPAR
ncbi:MAG: DUF5985 family protein [Thermoleophilia bacterium]